MRTTWLLAFGFLFQCACVVSRAQSHVAGPDSILGKFYALNDLPSDCPINPSLLNRSAAGVAKFGGASGVIIEGGFFITARHVAESAKKRNRNKIRVQNAAGDWQELTITETDLTFHSLPYDFAVYRISGGRFDGIPARLRTTPVESNEAVFGIGFVWDPNKKDTPDQKKTVFGKIADANTSGQSFCEYTNEDDVAVIEDWKLEEPGCANTDYSKFKYRAREERDPLLTMTPMSFGMSGSPLFDKDGLIIGIGSNVLSSTPLRYDPLKFAVYVKTGNIAKSLGGH
mgnify:CR=1 FL=1